MFGRNNLVNIIQKGDLERLKKVLRKNPAALHQRLRWSIIEVEGDGRSIYGDVPLLHAAAYFNQPELIKYLVKEQGMDINAQRHPAGGFTPLYFAASYGHSYKAVKMLLELGAKLDPYTSSACMHKTYAYEKIKDLLRPYYEAQLKQKAQEEEKRQAEQAAINAMGTWKLGASNEVIFERDVSGVRLTETFNFTTKTRILIAESIKTESLSQPETKSFSEIPEMAKQAHAELVKLRGPMPRLQK